MELGLLMYTSETSVASRSSKKSLVRYTAIHHQTWTSLLSWWPAWRGRLFQSQTPPKRPPDDRRSSGVRHPTRFLWPPLPIDPTAATYRHSVGWVNGPSCPDCRSTDHTVAHLFSCPTHPMDQAPGNMWVATLQIAQLLAGLPVWPYVGLHHRTTLTPFLHNLHSCGWPLLFISSVRRPTSSSSPSLYTCGAGVNSPSAIQQQPDCSL